MQSLYVNILCWSALDYCICFEIIITLVIISSYYYYYFIDITVIIIVPQPGAKQCNTNYSSLSLKNVLEDEGGKKINLLRMIF